MFTDEQRYIPSFRSQGVWKRRSRAPAVERTVPEGAVSGRRKTDEKTKNPRHYRYAKHHSHWSSQLNKKNKTFFFQAFLSRQELSAKVRVDGYLLFVANSQKLKSYREIQLIYIITSEFRSVWLHLRYHFSISFCLAVFLYLNLSFALCALCVMCVRVCVFIKLCNERPTRDWNYQNWIVYAKFPSRIEKG